MSANEQELVNDNNLIIERASRLLSYLKEFVELRTKPITSIDQYQQVIWLSQIPNTSDSYSIAFGSSTNTELWISVRKPNLRKPPEVPEELKRWVNNADVNNSALDAPQLLDNIIDEVVEETEDGIITNTVVVLLKDEPLVIETWEQYLNEKWMPWAKVDREQRNTLKIFNDLFSLYQQQQRLGEAYEVVLGMGYLTWRKDSGFSIKRHLIVSQTIISFEPETARIYVGPGAEGARPTLEMDMVDINDRPEIEILKGIYDLIEDTGDAIWEGNSIHAILSSWINAIPNSTAYDQTVAPQTEVTASAMVTFSPALILRKRTERGFVRVYQDISEQIAKGGHLPKGLEILVKETLGDDTGYTEQTEHSIKISDSEIYFPLPSNNQQKEIAQLVENRPGVVVHGPPGTGKSLTIANLICHLLAKGNRVLVVSHAPRALEVLREKIPPEIASLCVVALGDDTKSMKGLEASVQSITNTYNSWDGEANQESIKRFEKQIDEARRREASLLTELREIRESETYVHNLKFGHYSGTLQQIAGQIREEKNEFKWFQFKIEPDIEPPLSQSDCIELLQLLRNYPESLRSDLKQISIDYFSLPEPSSFREFVRVENVRRDKLNEYKEVLSSKEYSILKVSTREQRQALKDVIKKLRMEVSAVSANSENWVLWCVENILNGHSQAYVELISLTENSLSIINKNLAIVADLSIGGLEENKKRAAKYHAEVLLDHLQKGGSLGWWIFRPKVVKEALAEIGQIDLDGKLCLDKDTLTDLINWLECDRQFELLAEYWGPYFITPSSPWIIRKGEYNDRLIKLKQCLDLSDHITEANNVFQNFEIELPDWGDTDKLFYYERLIDASFKAEELEEAQSAFKQCEEQASYSVTVPKAHPISKEFLDAVSYRDSEKYQNVYLNLKNYHELLESIHKKDQLLGRLSENGKVVADLLLESYQEPKWDVKITQLNEAWDWSRCREWITRMVDPEQQQYLLREIENTRLVIEENIKKLAAGKAWAHTINRINADEKVIGYLRAWELAVRRIGKGTGKHANQHRRDARANMEKCRSAIPAWVMPIYRVVETVEIKPDIFDVVIVDEASQSGPEALFLQYIAKKIVVVGDHKQISPEIIGIDHDDVEALRRRYLFDIPHSDVLGLEDSFFNQAYVRYSSQVQLREHFRCMPEIIQFSNNICYRETPLIPLKQYGAGRLNPVIKTVYVADGYQKGKSPNVTNLPEADCLVDQIVKCCSDSRYINKTMGVISLLGDNQAKIIQQLLTERLGPEEMEKRKLVCGDAYAFQGDERDIMFLSMVSSPQARIGTLSTLKAERRFNVACSRAKEQMWLFHSATLNDLSPTCYRHKLLSYCLNPQVDQILINNLNLNEIRSLAASSRRYKNQPPHPFDSWFEVDVFIRIAERGYRVIPQYEIAGYRIDLIVEGMKGRLAVECDGDEWHGPDRFEADNARQRQLERSGLQFWRVRGAVYYQDPEDALISLWETLEINSIYPSGDDRELVSHQPTYNEQINNAEDIRQMIISNSEDESLPVEEETSAQINLIEEQIDDNPSIISAMIPLEDEKKDIPKMSKEPKSKPIEEIGIFDSKPEKEMVHHKAGEKKATTSSNKTVVELLAEHNLKFIDNRGKQGMLWVIGGKELDSVMEQLRAKGINFKYKEEGGKATKHKPAWWSMADG